MKILNLVILCLLISPTVYSQGKHLKDIESVRSLSLKVAQLFKESKISTAANALRPYWPIPENELSNFESKTIQSLNILIERFGESEGIVKISEQSLKETAIKEVYLVKFEYSAIRLSFVYFKNNQGWLVNSFKWDDKFEEEFK